MYYNTKYNTIHNIYVFSCKKYIICLKACLFGRFRWLGRKIGRITGAKTKGGSKSVLGKKSQFLIHTIILHCRAF